MKRISIAVLAIACIATCIACTRAAAPDTTATAGRAGAPADDQLVCRKERIIGSHRRQEVCRYRSDLRREREAVRKDLRSTNASAPPPLE